MTRSRGWKREASADANHKATSNVCIAHMSPINSAVRYTVYHKTDGVKTIVNRVQGVSQSLASELISPSLLPILSKLSKPSTSASTRSTTLKTRTRCSRPSALLVNVIRRYQESIRQDLGTKSAHGMNPDSAVMPHISMTIKWTGDSQGVPFDELRRIKQETQDVKENRTKGLIIGEIEPVAVKSHKDLGSSGWNGWQSIVMETEYERVWDGQC